MLPVWRYMRKCVENREDDSTSTLKTIINKITIDEDWFEKMMDELEMVHPMSESRAADIELLENSVNPERLANNPVPLDYNTIKEIYRFIVK